MGIVGIDTWISSGEVRYRVPCSAFIFWLSLELPETKQSFGDSLKIPDVRRVRNSADQCLKPEED